MRALVSLRPLLAALAVAMCGLYGCGKTGPEHEATRGGGPARKLAPVAAQGAVSVATSNTTRLGGAEAATDAAAVARAVYPALTRATRPRTVVLVDEHDWLSALAASVLASAPTRAPILLSEGDDLPAITGDTLRALRPLGAPTLGGAQAIRLGTSATVPSGYVTRSLSASEPAFAAAAIEQLLVTLNGKSPHQAIVLSTDTPPALAMPAAGLAAESGAPILYVTPGQVPAETASVLQRLHRPSIYVIDAASIGRQALDRLHHYGAITTITTGTATPNPESAVANAIDVARFTDGAFGWGVKEPGHGLAFANGARPLDAPAAALLSATGDYAPLLLLASATGVPPALASYLADIQPAYGSSPEFAPVRGAYNHGWLIGDERAITAATQAQIDSMLEITPREQSSEEASQVE